MRWIFQSWVGTAGIAWLYSSEAEVGVKEGTLIVRVAYEAFGSAGQSLRSRAALRAHSMKHLWSQDVASPRPLWSSWQCDERALPASYLSCSASATMMPSGPRM